MARITFLICFAFALSSCNNSAPEREPDTDITHPTNDDEVSVTTIAEGLEVPWDVTFAGGRTFVTERDRGRVVELLNGSVEKLRDFDIDNAGEGGLLGLAASPNFDDDRLLYAYKTTAEDNRVVRFSVDDQDDAEPVLTGIPKGPIHNGGRIAFGPDEHLWITTGDAAEPDLSQDEESLAGKILRVTADGSIPQDNPTEGSPVYAMGLRNVQGLAWDADDNLYATEFGPDVDDEVNRIEATKNYGWPEVTGTAEESDFEDPIFVRQPSVASWSGATFLVDASIPDWENHLFVAALRGSRIWRLELSDDGQVIADEELFTDRWGRLRHITQAPDGSLWVLTSNRDGRGDPVDGDDRIVRIGH